MFFKTRDLKKEKLYFIPIKVWFFFSTSRPEVWSMCFKFGRYLVLFQTRKGWKFWCKVRTLDLGPNNTDSVPYITLAWDFFWPGWRSHKLPRVLVSVLKLQSLWKLFRISSLQLVNVASCISPMQLWKDHGFVFSVTTPSGNRRSQSESQLVLSFPRLSKSSSISLHSHNIPSHLLTILVAVWLTLSS